MKTSCSDNPLTLRILAVSNRHKQYSPFATSKISNCLPQPQIALSKFFLHLNTDSTYPPHPTFSSSRKILRRTFPSLGTHFRTKNLRSLDPYQQQQDKILDPPCIPNPRIKPGTNKDEISAGPK